MRQPLSLSPLLRLATKRTRSGQALVLMAAAMIVLIAFVGIATDISLLFVRYNALRRAVDAASIAVAGQVRTGVDFAQLNTVARQFVQLQGGINPDTVKVETCETDIFDYVTAYRAQFGPAAPATIPPDPVDTAAGSSVFRPLNHVITGTGQLYTMFPNRPKSELCKFDPQKLVRVSAQLRSETVFLTLLGWREVMLSVSTVSQTAVLDVALVIDNSASMSDDTITDETNYDKYPCQSYTRDQCSSKNTYNGAVKYPSAGMQTLWDSNYAALLDFKQLTNSPTSATDPGFLLQPALPIRNVNVTPPPIDYTDDTTIDTTSLPYYNNDVDTTNFTATLTVPTDPYYPAATKADLTIRAECMYNTQFLAAGWDNGIPRNIDINKMANYGWGGCCNDPTVQSNQPVGQLTSVVSGYQEFPTAGTAQTATKLAFQSKVSPDWYLYDDGVSPQSEIGITGTFSNGAGGARRIRSMDNVTYQVKDLSDPNHVKVNGAILNNGDGNFSDLICQPFRQVRDAARRFIRRLDFVRGDRLAIITFSDVGQLVCPNYDAEFRTDAFDTPCAGDPFIYDRDLAVRTLNFKVGVVHNWGKNFGWQEKCRSLQTEYNPSKALNYWVVSQCQNTNTGGAINAARNALKGQYKRREAVWVMIMLSDGAANRSPYLGSFDLDGTQKNFSMVNRQSSQPLRNWNEVPETERPATSNINGVNGTVPASDVKEYCSYWDPVENRQVYEKGTGGRYAPLQQFPIGNCNTTDYPQLSTYFGYDSGTPADILRRCLRYGSKPQLCEGFYTSGSATTEKYSYGYCPWSDFCLSLNDANVSPVTASNDSNYLATYSYPQQCFKSAGTPNTFGQIPISGAIPELDDPASWPITSSSIPYSPYCTDNDPDSRHFCANSLGWINAYDEDINNNKQADETTVGANVYCSKYYDADDYARDQADWGGLIQYTDRTPGDFIAMFTIFFAKKQTNGTERDLGENILGVKLMRYISDAGDNGRIDNNLQEFYRHFRGDFTLANDPRYFVTQAQPIAAYNGRTFLQYKNGVGIYNANPTYKDWMDLDQDDCSQWDYNEYSTSGGYRTLFPGQPQYEDIARRDCGQYWFANDISKVNRAFTEIAGRLFTRLAR